MVDVQDLSVQIPRETRDRIEAGWRLAWGIHVGLRRINVLAREAHVVFPKPHPSAASEGCCTPSPVSRTPALSA